MDFKMQDLKLDMGTTPLENMFLNTYVQMADGDQLKVYLLIYKDCYNYRRVDSAKIKRQLRFSDERFDKAVDFWVNMGVFRQKRADNGTDFIEIVSLRQMYFGDSEDNESTEAAYDLAQRKSIMFSNIETIIERSLTPADITRIQEALLEYNSDPELVTEAFRQAKASGNVDVKYVIGFVKTWRDQNIKSLNDLRMKEERDKLVRKRSTRKYRRNPASARKEASDNDEISSFIQRRKEERFNRIINQRGEDNDS